MFSNQHNRAKLAISNDMETLHICENQSALLNNPWLEEAITRERIKIF
jgi:hypothetical protein